MITIEEIVKIVCEVTHTPVDRILSKSRERVYVLPRQIAQTIATIRTGMPLVKIGEYFGRDHSTIIHSKQSVENWISQRHLPIEASVYIECLNKVTNYERDNYNMISASILLTPHSVPTC